MYRISFLLLQLALTWLQLGFALTGQCTAVHIRSLVPSVSGLICSSIRILYLFIFWLWWVFFAAHRLSLAVASGGYSLLQWAGFSMQWFLLLQSIGSSRKGFSTCIALWIAGLRVQAQ